MTEFLFFVVVLVVIWIARSAAMRARTTDSVVSKLTSRVFNLEEELKQLRKLIRNERPEKPPVPVMTEVGVELPPVARPLKAIVPKPPAVPLPDATFADQRTSGIIETPLPVEALPVAVADTQAPPVRPPISFDEPAGFSPGNMLNLEETLGTNWLNKLGIVIRPGGISKHDSCSRIIWRNNRVFSNIEGGIGSFPHWEGFEEAQTERAVLVGMDSEVGDRNVAKVDRVDIDHCSHLERTVTAKSDSCRTIGTVNPREKPSAKQDSC